MKLLSSLRNARPEPDITIHLYALCWNEERMLPYFFRHYDNIVDRYFIFDNGSTDRSLELLKANPKVVLDTFDVQGDSFVLAALNHYNHCWKQSRGNCDWVIVCNVDEHLYHSDLRRYLRACKTKGASLIVPKGYNMVSDTFPEEEKPLYDICKYGMRDRSCDKPEVFDPNMIREIHFEVGRHSAQPEGEVRTPRRVHTKLLHYKYVGLNYLVLRHAELRSGLRDWDILNAWGYQYFWDKESNLKEFQRLKMGSRSVL